MKIQPKTYIHTGDANVDIWPAKDGNVVVCTHNLSDDRVVGLNGSGFDLGERVRVMRNGAAPGAKTLTVKSGTAAAGTAIGVIPASENGFIDVEWDGGAFRAIGIGGV